MGENDSVKKVHAPYNFVPFSNRLIKRYEKIQDLPPHDKIDPNLKTGEIRVRLVAEMPVYISNGKEKNQEEFFRGPDGTYQIPGSSVRGMLRENMQILGLGLVRPGEDLDDYQIYFRDMASAKGSVSGSVKKTYTDILGVKTEKVNGQAGKKAKSISIPQKVCAGFLERKNGTLFIQPANYYRASRKNEGMRAFEKGGKVPAISYFKVAFTDDGGWVRKIVPLEKKEAGMKTGTLLSTGNSVKNPNALYVIEDVKEEREKERIFPVAKEDELSYQADLESRRNALNGMYKTTEFWELPKEGESKAVFYVEYNGHVFFGMALFLRVGYPNRISDGLPAKHKEAVSEEEAEPFLDYPASMMGFASKDLAYRSRISVGDFRAIKEVPCKETYYMVGGEPKPSYYAGYLKNGESYADNEFQLRGYKQYWMREKVYKVAELKNENMGKRVRPLGKGSVFEGVIRFKNLQEDELGLLLWALMLEEGCYQSVGMGKPYGLGRVSVQIAELKIVNVSQRYSAESFLTRKGYQCGNAKEYVEKYKTYASELLKMEKEKGEEKSGKKSSKKGSKKADRIEDQSRIQDFFFIHRISVLSEEEMSYMELKEFQNTREYQEELRTLRKEAEDEKKKETPKEEKKIGGLDFSNFKFNVRS